MNFTGRSISYAYNALKQVKDSVGQDKHNLITIQEFVDFHRIPVKELTDMLFKKY